MPSAPTDRRPRIVLPVASWIDPRQWADAPEATRRRLLEHVAARALARKRSELLRGIGADGAKLEPVSPRSRPDGAKGPPLAPHRAGSRAYRNLKTSIGLKAGTVTLWWAGRIGRYGTGTILLFHALGVVIGAYQRDVLGIAPAGLRALQAEARRFWRLVHRPAPRQRVRPELDSGPVRVPVAAVVPGPLAAVARPGQPRAATVGRGGLAEGLVFARPPGAEDGRRYTVVLADVRRLETTLARDIGFHVGAGGSGAGIAGRYAEARRFLERARAGRVPVHMPRLALADRRTGEVAITDGRHRFAVLRDAGATALPVVVPRGDAERFRALYGYGVGLMRPRRRTAPRAFRPSP